MLSIIDPMECLAEECYLAEKSDTWYPDYAYCTNCQGFIFAPSADSLDLGMCPCAVLDEVIAQDEEEEDETHFCPTALTLSDALGIEPVSKSTMNLSDARIARRLQQPATRHFGRGHHTGFIQRNQRKHRNIMQPRPGF